MVCASAWERAPTEYCGAGVGLAGAYGFYAFCALLSLIFVAFFIRETKGRELEEMGYQ